MGSEGRRAPSIHLRFELPNVHFMFTVVDKSDYTFADRWWIAHKGLTVEAARWTDGMASPTFRWVAVISMLDLLDINVIIAAGQGHIAPVIVY